MGNISGRERKFDHTQDETRLKEERKEIYWRNKQEHENIEERNDDDVNRYFQQEEVQPGMHTYCLD
jgi:hypothetical protein